MAKVFDLFTFGETLALFMTTDTDSVITAQNYSMTAAGTEANVAVAAHQLGLNVYFQTKLGPDELGIAVSNKFAEVGLETKHFITCENYTGALVRNHGGTQPFVNTYLRRCSAGSTFSPADLDEAALAKSKWLHVTGISVAISDTSKSAVIRALDVARANKVGISFDLNYRKKLWDEEIASTTLKSIIKDLDVVSGGIDEYEIIFGSKDPEENLSRVAALGVKTAIMTAGPGEMRILHEGRRFDFTPTKVKLVDPVGSGDAFISGTISGLIGGLSIEEAIAQGSKCGAAVAATRGDWALMITGKDGVLMSITSGVLNGQ
ncbi:RbsK Sugar kinases, ribokinase family [actinobacterium SCGC AAA044-D11]